MIKGKEPPSPKESLVYIKKGSACLGQGKTTQVVRDIKAPHFYFDLVSTLQDINASLLAHKIRDFEAEILIFFFVKSFDIQMSEFLFTWI